MMLHLSWDAEEPPNDPPADCVNPPAWAEAFKLWGEHQLKDGVWCRCRRRWPCTEYKLAVRGLVNACTPTASPFGTHDLVIREQPSTCRWCDVEIWFSEFGWMHRNAGLFLCQRPKVGSPPLCVAEPKS